MAECGYRGIAMAMSLVVNINVSNYGFGNSYGDHAMCVAIGENLKLP